MTEKEKNALKEAFGFEEPDRKEEFVQQFTRIDSDNNKKPIFPFIIKLAAAAAMMAAIIGTAVMMPKDIKHFSSDDIVTETTTETTAPVSTEKAETVTAPQTTTKEKFTSTATVSATKTEKTTVSTTQTTAATAKATSSAAKTATTPATAAPQIRNTTTVMAEAEQPTTKLTEQQVKEESSPGLRYRDLTVSVDKNYPRRGKTITEEEYSRSASHKPEIIGENSADESFQPKDNAENSINIDISEMYNNSCAVVLANLDEIVYTSIGGETFTAENITVSKVYKGDIQIDDMITVFFKGGFIPAEEYSELYNFPPITDQEEYSVEVAGESGGRQEQGHFYIFFLRNSGETLPDGAYSPANMGNMSVFELQYGLYRAVGDGSLTFTISQAENGF